MVWIGREVGVLGVELFNASWKRSCKVGVMCMLGKSASVVDCLEKRKNCCPSNYWLGRYCLAQLQWNFTTILLADDELLVGWKKKIGSSLKLKTRAKGPFPIHMNRFNICTRRLRERCLFLKKIFLVLKPYRNFSMVLLRQKRMEALGCGYQLWLGAGNQQPERMKPSSSLPSWIPNSNATTNSLGETKPNKIVELD